MSVPLDRLYNFLHGVCNHDVVIYRFFPHGSKKITDLTTINQERSKLGHRLMICHDQEPLHYDLYDNIETVENFYAHSKQIESPNFKNFSPALFEEHKQKLSKLNLRMVHAGTVYNRELILLLNSEKRSAELEKYLSIGFVGVYWWSHGLIARDWFRYAEHDSLLDQKQRTFDFLIYNRAWSGTREYRVKFAELLVNNQLQSHCLTKFNPTDSNQHYTDYGFKNQDFKPSMLNLETYFEPNTSTPEASADYSTTDYQQTEIEIVLETLFDDQRLHLTEKSLRPIACGQPFMLAATHGSLEYIRSYGFETFSPWINETYDTIEEPRLRLDAIIAEMKRISALPAEEKTKLYNAIRSIAKKNRALFFSKQWHDLLIQEFKTNFNQAIQTPGEYSFSF